MSLCGPEQFKPSVQFRVSNIVSVSQSPSSSVVSVFLSVAFLLGKHCVGLGTTSCFLTKRACTVLCYVQDVGERLSMNL